MIESQLLLTSTGDSDIKNEEAYIVWGFYC